MTTTTTKHPLSTKPIKRPPLPLKRIHDIQTRHRLALGMLGVGDRIANHALEECFQDTAGFFVDHWGGGGLISIRGLCGQ